MPKSAVKSILIIILSLAGIQLALFLIKQVVFIFIDRTFFSDSMASAVAMIILTVAITLITRKTKLPLSLVPPIKKTSQTIFYVIMTVVTIFILLSTPFITGEKSIGSVLILIYGAVITPIFEELLFRGAIWNKLKDVCKNEVTVFIITAVLFGLWHLGYAETIMYRAPDKNIYFIMLMKVLVGLGYGIVLGLVRLKAKNCYITILLHSIANTIGS